MSLRSEAIAAYQADWEADGRKVLADVLTPFDVSTLDVLSLDVRAKFTAVVYSDGDIHLAVQMFADSTPSAVSLVASDGAGGWTKQVEVTSLAQLGKVLPQYDPTDENAAPPAWATGTAYVVGDKATYGGATYSCLQAHTSQAGWEPPNAPSLWSAA